MRPVYYLWSLVPSFRPLWTAPHRSTRLRCANLLRERQQILYLGMRLDARRIEKTRILLLHDAGGICCNDVGATAARGLLRDQRDLFVIVGVGVVGVVVDCNVLFLRNYCVI